MRDGVGSRTGEIEQPQALRRATKSRPFWSYLSFGHPGNWPVLIVVLMCLALFPFEFLTYLRGQSLDALVFSPEAMAQGRYYTLVTAIFTHLRLSELWWAVAMYVLVAPLVIARFGKGWAALFPFHVFFVLCGVAGHLAYWAFHPQVGAPINGAFGAIFGVLGAVIRLDIYSDRLKPIFSARTLKGVLLFVMVNIVMVYELTLRTMVRNLPSYHIWGYAFSRTAWVHWESHLGGFVAGFLLIGLMAGRGWPGPWRAGLIVNPGDRMLNEPIQTSG